MYVKFANTSLKQHHHIRLDAEYKADCKVWLSFLQQNGRASVCRPFIDLEEKLNAVELDFYSDAAKGVKLGLGAVFQQHWLFAQWENDYINVCNPSIEYLELLGLCIAVFAWSEELRNRCFIVFCDNQSVVTMVNNTTAKCANCMMLIRLLTLRSLIFNMRVFTKWTPSSKNIRANLLSRQKINKFMKITKDKQIDPLPTTLPE